MATAKSKPKSDATPERDSTNRVRKTKAELIAERRGVRNDLGSMRNVILTPDVEGLVFRWVNDEMRSGRNRIELFKERGWHVYEGRGVQVADHNVKDSNTSLGSSSRITVGTTETKEALSAVLMCISKELYDIDQQLKQEEIDEAEQGLRDSANAGGHYGAIRIGDI